MIKRFLNKFITLRASKRSDNVVYSLLLFFWVIALILLITSSINRIILGDNYQGDSPYSILFTILIITAIVQTYRRGFRNIINSLFLVLLFVCSAYIVLESGPENPYAILLMVFYIVITAIMFSGKRFFFFISLITTSYLAVGYLESRELVKPELSWKLENTSMADVVGITVFLTLIIFISWLFNFEINNYISRLEESKKLLKKERDILEERVKERTAQLQSEQRDRLAELSKLAEFGRLAQGLFHDLVNPLTALSLNLNQAKKEKDTA